MVGQGAVVAGGRGDQHGVVAAAAQFTDVVDGDPDGPPEGAVGSDEGDDVQDAQAR